MKYLPYIVIAALIVALLNQFGKAEPTPRSETITIVDTIHVDRPVASDSVNVGGKKVRLPVANKNKNNDNSLVTDLVSSLDTSLVTSDSVEVTIPTSTPIKLKTKEWQNTSKLRTGPDSLANTMALDMPRTITTY